jgi:hypothetical protein
MTDPNPILQAAALLLPGVVCAPVRPSEERLGLHLPDGDRVGSLAALGDLWSAEVELTPEVIAAMVRAWC